MSVPYEEKTAAGKLRMAQRRQEILARFGRMVLQDVALQELLQQAAALASEGMQVRRAKVLQYQPQTDDLLIRAGIGWKEGVVGRVALPSDLASPPGYAFRTGEPLAIEDLPKSDRFRHSDLLREHGVVALLNVPIKTDGHTFGVLEVDSQQHRRFSQDGVHFLFGFASLLGAAIRRRQVESELQREKGLSELLIKSSTAGIFAFDSDLRCTLWNPAMEAITGFRPEQALGQDLLELFPFATGTPVEEGLHQALWGETPSLHDQPYVIPQSGADGFFDAHYAPLHGPDGTIVGGVGFVRETTERRRQMDAVMQQYQKMEAIGQLTGGVAHDFNNLLTVITANLDLIEAKAGRNTKLRKLVGAAQRAAERGQRLTGQLLAFARRQALRPETVSVNELIEECLSLARQATGETVRIELALEPGLWACHIDPAQFEAAMLNLLVNARDAMPSGGTVRIETRNIVLDRRSASAIPDLSPGRYIAVTVADNGAGMSPDVLQRAVEPFFTTKDVGKGTGLGLSQVYGFARQSGGQVQIESAPGTGTTVRLYLPRCDDSKASEISTGMLSAGQEAVTGGSERVLVVEDDEDVLEAVLETLSSLGYRVSVARDGPQALAALEHAGPFDLLFTDIMMPNGMDGLEIAHHARQRCPETSILLTTGYAPDPALAGVLRSERYHILRKPYRQTTLAAKLRAALGLSRARVAS